MKIILNDYLKDKIDIFSMYSQNSDESLGKLFVYLIQKKNAILIENIKRILWDSHLFGFQ